MLSETTIKSARPRKPKKGEQAKRRELWDQFGLVLVIQPSGAKSFVYRSREKGTKTTGKVYVGPYDATGGFASERTVGSPQTLVSARRNVGILREERKAGVDIVAKYRVEKHRAKHGGGDTFPDAVKFYAAQKRAKGVRGWAASARVLGLDYSDPDNPKTIKGGLCERWGDKGFRDIDPGMIAMVVDEAIARALPGREARNPGEHSEARGRELAAALSSLFGFLKKKVWVNTNPVTVKPDKAPERERLLSDAELVSVLKAASTMGAPWSQFIHVLALTGARRDEIADLRWAELSDDRPCCRFLQRA